MSLGFRSLVLASLTLACVVFANDKKKNVLPAYVLNARTVLVMIEPDAGAPITDLTGNKKALDDVERAISKWGWLTPVQDAQTADLIITIRKGHDRIVEPTIGGGPVNDRPVVIQSTDSSVRIAGRGRQSDPSADPTDPSRGPQNPSLHPQTEIGSANDSFSVYQGQVEHPLNRAPAWRFVGKNALHAPNVPAVTEFRKAVEEAQKQQKNP
jgi:hypothetical protein